MADLKKPQKTILVQDDPWLEPYEEDILSRKKRVESKLKDLEDQYGSLEKFAAGYHYFGVNYDKKLKGWFYREWAPEAKALSLIGDFNNWDREANPLSKNDEGIWELFLPEKEFGKTFIHGSKYKVHVVGANGAFDRLPAYTFRAIQDEKTHDFSAQHWEPEKTFKWKAKNFSPEEIGAPIIYECHVGMALEREGLGTYREFTDEVLPRIAELGYNCIQLMAVQEHPYYGSFGYHVSNFFAPSSRFGSPEDLKYLIDTAHSLGIAVIMDLVHSHAVKNFAEGLNDFDGSGGQYFHEGGRGHHDSWDSKLFNYGKKEVLRFLLSNVAYWLKEYRFDGFRFDGVTSMMYFHHGEYVDFDHYDKYFKDGVEWDAIIYLQLANLLIHSIQPHGISIAEDMSGMPGLCRTLEDGGLGFDYRLGMGIPDYWIKILKHKRDDEWDIHEMWGVMTNRRYKEATIAYAESHDQALVGDKTLAFWLMDKEMYWHMSVDDDNIQIDRGIALHKLINLFTLALGGEGYLNFIGNEFGHPEWVDFPREGNGWSYKYARRQWSLVDNENLKYKYLSEFNKGIVHLAKSSNLLQSLPAQQLNMDVLNKVIIFERANLIFVFNFHPTKSIAGYEFFVPQTGAYQIVLQTDKPDFGGHNRLDEQVSYETNKSRKLTIYIPNRTAIILKRTKS